MIISKIKNLFLRATKGEESIKNLIFCLIGFLPFYFILKIFFFKIFIISTIFKTINILFLLWHIFATIRCKPKKEKKQISFKKISKSLTDKLLLKKPWLNLKITTFVILVDILLILNIY
jgi:hypothetical protein